MISVAMTTYNGAKYLDKQISSIMNQTVPVDEIIVCDDRSTDHTLEILRKYPVKVIVNDFNLGFKKNFKKAVSLCSGDRILLCDQDDIWEKNKVEELIKCMESNPQMHVCASSFACVDSKDHFLNEGKTFQLYPKKVIKNELVEVNFNSLISTNYFQGSSMIIDRWIANQFLKFYDGKIEHDWFICMLAASYHSMYFYNKPLFQYRIHEKNEIGIPSIKGSPKDHLNTANKLNIRLQPAKNVLDLLEILEKANSEYYAANKIEFDAVKKFSYEHIEYMKNHNLMGILKQNFSPYYGMIMTRNARIMDLIFTLKEGWK